jgi:hypothetical protein
MDKLIPVHTLKVGQPFSADRCHSWWVATHIAAHNGQVVITATLISKWSCDACQANEAHTQSYCDMHGKQQPPKSHLPKMVGIETYFPTQLVQVHG